MITVLVDSQNDKFDYYNEMSITLGLNEGFEKSESFITKLSRDILDQMSKLNLKEETKLIALVHVLSSKTVASDFLKFCTVENTQSSGGIRAISIPELYIDNHLLMWSKLYGVMILSLNPISDDTIKLKGDFLIVFDRIPPFILVTNTENDLNSFKIIEEQKHKEINEQLGEVLAEFSQLIFDKWEEYGEKTNMQSKYNFSFVVRNNDLEC